MRVTLLGTGSADGWPNPFCTCASCTAERADGRSRRTASALVDDAVLIDCGPTTPHIPGGRLHLRDVEHVLVTHGHPDHLHPAFLLTRRWTAPGTTLHVWGPPLAIDMCREWVGPGSAVELHVVEPGERWTLPCASGAYTAQALAAAHAHGDGDTVAAEALLYVVTAPDGGRLLYATDTGPLPAATIATIDGRCDVVLIDETFGDTSDHGTGHLDLTRLPAVLHDLRAHGCIGDDTTVVATHLSHHNPPTRALRQRLATHRVRVVDDLAVIDTDRPQGGLAVRHLVTGGARSGKSRFAEAVASRYGDVTYVATGGTRADDPEWATRVAAHQARRPAHWTTLETTDARAVLDAAEHGSAVLIDCAALWLTSQLDELDAWARLARGEHAAVTTEAALRIDDLVSALQACRADVIVVTNEVGMGIVPDTASARLFRDLLGIANARIAAAATTATLVVAGRPLTLENPVEQ